jgi:hypothetical protein
MVKRTLFVLATALGLAGLFGTGVASANFPDLLVGLREPTNTEYCLGVILDNDGVYNNPRPGGNGYDALLCTGRNTRESLGWSHTSGYMRYQGKCYDEYNASVFPEQFIRHIPAVSVSTNRAISSTLNYLIEEVPC